MSTTALAEPTLTKALDDRPLSEIDPAIHAVLEDEKQRQSTHIELIASENFTLPAIIETTGSVLIHAGTKAENGEVVTAGGRVLGAVGMGPTLADAKEKAYQLAEAVKFESKYYRSDIGHREFSRT